ncbi:MAG TPA: hypothetical protein VG708_12935 [Mycobacteriales bacterium]|nr:hypothetical protein [Mycobacteriales bacterium]
MLGLALATAPVAFDMFARAPKGAVMMDDFKPFMTAQRLDGYQGDIASIGRAVHEVDTTVKSRLRSHGRSLPGSYRRLSDRWPQINATMRRLLDRVQANLGNHRAVAALPSFRLFPWFFVIPGVLILLVAAAALLRWLPLTGARIGLGVLGLGLVLAPVAFQMFTRAPQGARMMSAFRTIETTSNVQRIQGYFSTMAVGQGAVRIDVVPALTRTGLTAQQVDRRYPATAHLDAQWVHILNDMTPMIGAMSDSVPRYQAISALPSFTLFPWFFLIPGVFTGALACWARRRAITTEEPLEAKTPEPEGAR